MSEPNPYQSPLSPKPLGPAQIVKRGLGVAAILLLTPVAVVITTFVSCGAAIAAQYAAEPYVGKDNPYLILSIWFGPPLVVLVAMCTWAWKVYLRNKAATEHEGRAKDT